MSAYCPSQPSLFPSLPHNVYTRPPPFTHPHPHTFSPFPTLEGDSTGGRITGDLLGEVCGEGCDGREGRREAGSLPAHVPVVPLSRAAGSSGERSRGEKRERGVGEERERSKKRGDRKEKKLERILSTLQQINDSIHSHTYHTLPLPSPSLPSSPLPPLSSPLLPSPIFPSPLISNFLISCFRARRTSILSLHSVSHRSFWNPMLLSWLHHGTAPDRLVAPVSPGEPGQNAQSLVRPSSHF